VLPDRGPLAADLAAAGVEVHNRSLSVIRRQQLNPVGVAATVARAARDAAGLSQLIRRRHIELVHSNTSAVLGGAAAAAAARVRHVWHIREIYARFGRLWPAHRRLLSSAAALPCVSEAAAAQFGPRASTTVINDGLAFDAHRAPRDLARRALGLAADAPVIAVLGRITDWKGQGILVRALAERPLAERGAVALIAGEPWPGAEHRLTAVLELATRLGVSERVRLAGFCDDVALVYGAADVIAVPSTAPDPLPGAAIEAAAAGCAVIASADGGLPEIIRDGETGRLVTPGDPGALAKAAAELVDDPVERRRLGEAAAHDVRSRFAPEALLKRIQTLYAGLL